MNTRYIANPSTRDVRNFMLANRHEGGHIDARGRIAKFTLAAVLVTGIAAITPFVLYSKRTPPTINVDGSSAIMQKGFCAIRCSRSGKGAFHSNDVVYVEDWSQGDKYWKKFYDKNENMLVEGIGNKSERWFFNPDYKGKARLARAIKLGNEWQMMREYNGEEAVRKWSEARRNY